MLYVNRSTEQQLFTEALQQGNYLDINGIYGQGKTTFLKWIHVKRNAYRCDWWGVVGYCACENSI